MERIEKTVFLSYRRTNAPWALAISQNLTQHGFDVFFDFNGIASGDFAKVIIENIKARAHFVVLLTPSALDRCGERGDWLRREIETAFAVKRNIVPLTLEGFDFATPKIVSQLTGSLAPLKGYNALSVPVEYFDEAMTRLREKYLNLPLKAVLHPASEPAKNVAKKEQEAASLAPPVSDRELTAQELYERGFNAKEADDKFWFFSESIRLRPASSPLSNDEDSTQLEGLEQENLLPSPGPLLEKRNEMFRLAMDDLGHSTDVTLEALGSALDLMNPLAPGHSKRVTVFSIAISRALGINTKEIKTIARGAFLHNIGTLVKTHSAIREGGVLSPINQSAKRLDVEFGYDFLKRIPFLKEAAVIVLHQDEHYDGTGVPRGLRGNQIPVGARILAVALNLDSMTTERPNHKSQSFEAAQREILRSSGSLFDPDVVEVFLRIPIKLWHELQLEIDNLHRSGS